VHESQVDVITVLSGEGTLVVGGTAVDAHPTTAGEMRGKSINGGTSHKMAAGDVFHIPAKVPHQMLVPKSLVIQVIKVDSK
jgi:quercetin dioxygenase-like cupin family protein